MGDGVLINVFVIWENVKHEANLRITIGFKK